MVPSIHTCSNPHTGDFCSTKRNIMTPNRACSLIRLLVLALTLMHLAHGKAIKRRRASEKTSDNCPTQEGSKFPDTIDVRIGIVHKDLASRRPHDVRNRSTSPWDYRINEDPNRFPHMISEANCRYIFCLDSQGKETIGLNSVPIQQEILVIKRKQIGCRQSYWLEKQVVTVGCTCAIPTTTAYSG